MSERSKYPATQAARPAPSTEIKAQVFRERDAAAKAAEAEKKGRASR